MPLSAPAPFSSSFPALYLYPLNDSFVPKHISLLHNQRVKIGRQTNAKTAPGERNGFFDSKVLSRQHAEVWEEESKIFIKDVKSSNGTFINGERLSPEGLESEPFVLKSDDIVEFGIDIVGEDNKTIIHHKVAARVLCILSEQDAQMAARTEQLQMQQLHQQYSPSGSNMSPQGPPSMMNQAGPSNGAPGAGPSNSGFGFPNQQQQQRRPMMHQNGISGMGGMGGSMRPPGKSGLTFDHILTRLQGELQKSRETSSELHSVTGAMNEIHETLGGGGLPPNAPPFSQPLPPVRPPTHSHQQQEQPSAEQSSDQFMEASSSNSALLSELQAQLLDTQNSLTQHVDKVRALENALQEQETIRHEVRMLREMMDALRQRDFSDSKDSMPRNGPFDLLDEDASDDDAMSIGTAVPHELERVDEEEEEQIAHDEMESSPNGIDEAHAQPDYQEEFDQSRDESYDREEDDEERQRRRQELGRPHTPEPTNLGLRDSGDLYEHRKRSKTLTASRSPITNGITHSVVDELTSRMATLSSQLEVALELSSNLQVQHTTAQSTIQSLESKVESLEKLVTVKLSQQQNGSASSTSPVPASVEPVSASQFESLTAMVNEWKKSVEGQWSGVQEEWSQERERISRAREEWEAKVHSMDTGLEKLDRLQRTVNSNYFFNGNGDVVRDHGLATPPSPRSISADSQKPRRRRSSGRGRSGSRRRGSTEQPQALEAVATPERPDDLSASAKITRAGTQTVHHLATPAPTINGSPIISSPTNDTHSTHSNFNPTQSNKSSGVLHTSLQQPHMQTAVGVLMLSIAAAAVIWRVKPE